MKSYLYVLCILLIFSCSDGGVTTVPEQSIPVSPSNLEILEIGAEFVRVSWDSVEDASTYNIYIDNAISISGIRSSINSYYVPNLTPESDYVISITSSNEFGESPQSNSLLFRTIEKIVYPAKPSGLQMSLRSDNSIDIEWNSSDDYLRYSIYYKNVSNFDQVDPFLVSEYHHAGDIQGTTFSIQSLNANSNYLICIVGHAESDYKRASDILQATTLEVGTNESGVLLYKIDQNNNAIITGTNLDEPEELEIPAVIDGLNVVGIASGAFQGLATLTGMTLADTILSIGEYAFSGCTSLSQFNFPTALETIEKRAFAFTAIETVTLPEGVHLLGEEAFWTARLNKVVFPSTLTTISARAFVDCDYLSEIVFPQTITLIEENAFNGCRSLKTLILPEGLIGIEEEAFVFCSELEIIQFPSTLEYIDSAAFAFCNSLATVNIPGNIKRIGPIAIGSTDIGVFWGCVNLSEVHLAEGIEQIGHFTFSNCRNLTEITIPNSIHFIGSEIFYQCNGVTVTIKAGRTEIPSRFLSSQANIEEVILPEGIIYIREDALAIDDLLRINIPTTLQQIESGVFEWCFDLNVMVDEGRTEIPANFFDRLHFKEIYLPASITTIGAEAFLYCRFLENISLSTNVNSIGSDAFKVGEENYDNGLRLTVSIRDSGSGVIPGNFIVDQTEIYNIIIEDGIQNISTGAFSNLVNLEKITFPASVNTLDSSIISGCPSLENLYFEGISAPNTSSDSFSGISDCTLHIPTGAIGYDTGIWLPAAGHFSAIQFM